jgi:hypothetical protein
MIAYNSTTSHMRWQDELLSVMGDGAANRAVAATGMNEGSSRYKSITAASPSLKSEQVALCVHNDCKSERHLNGNNKGRKASSGRSCGYGCVHRHYTDV